jgi:hypothetical protein
MDYNAHVALGRSVVASFNHVGIQECYTMLTMFGHSGIKFSKLSRDNRSAFKDSTEKDSKIKGRIVVLLENNTHCSGTLYVLGDNDFTNLYVRKISDTLLFYLPSLVCNSTLTELYEKDPSLIINAADDNIIRYMTCTDSADTVCRVPLLEHLIGAERSKQINLKIKDTFGSDYVFSFTPSSSSLSKCYFRQEPIPPVPSLRLSCNCACSQALKKIYNTPATIGIISPHYSVELSVISEETQKKLTKTIADNRRLLAKEFKAETSARNMKITTDVEKQAIDIGVSALLIQLPILDNIIIMRTLFPRGMFHIFSNSEESLMIHLHPQKQGFLTGLWNKITGNITQTLSQPNRMFWLECIAGVMRSKAIKDYVECPLGKISLSKFLGVDDISEPISVAVPVKPTLTCSGISPDYGPVISDLDYIEFSSKVVRSIYAEEGLADKIDPEMSSSDSPDWSRVKPEVYSALVDAFRNNKVKIAKVIDEALQSLKIEVNEEMRNFLTDRAAGGLILSIPTDYSMLLVRTLFPKGLFHLFKGAEYVLMNHLEPSGRDLTADERLFWLECLTGTRRAQSINENIANPMKGFSLDMFSQYKVSERDRIAWKAKQKQSSNRSKPYKQTYDENGKRHED